MSFTLHCAFYEASLLCRKNHRPLDHAAPSDAVQNITIHFDQTPPLHEVKRAALLMAATYAPTTDIRSEKTGPTNLLTLFPIATAAEENRWAVELFGLSAATRTWRPIFSANQIATGDQVFAIFLDTLSNSSPSQTNMDNNNNDNNSQVKKKKRLPPPFATFSHTLRSIYYYAVPPEGDRVASLHNDALHFDNDALNPLTSTDRGKLFWSDYQLQMDRRKKTPTHPNPELSNRGEGENSSPQRHTSYHPLHNMDLQSPSQRRDSNFVTAPLAASASRSHSTIMNSTVNANNSMSHRLSIPAAGAAAARLSGASSTLSLFSTELHNTANTSHSRASAASGGVGPTVSHLTPGTLTRASIHHDPHNNNNDKDKEWLWHSTDTGQQEKEVLVRRIQSCFHALDVEKKGYIVLRDFYTCFLPLLLPAAKSGADPGGDVPFAQRRRSQQQHLFSTYTFPTELTHGGFNKSNPKGASMHSISRGSVHGAGQSKSLSGPLSATSRSLSYMRPFRRSCGCPTHTHTRCSAAAPSVQSRSRATSDAVAAAARERGECTDEDDVVTPEMFQLFYVDPKRPKERNGFRPNKENAFGSAPQEQRRRLRAREEALFTLTFEEIIRRGDDDRDGKLFLAEWNRFGLLHPQVVAALHKYMPGKM